MANKTIDKISVKNEIYDVVDSTISSPVRSITQDDINAWNTSAGKALDYNVMNNKPSINGVELKGNLTGEELGISGDLNYVYRQSTASDTWVIIHNLNKYPSVSVIDSAGSEVFGDIIYNSTNQVTLKFEGGFKGTATLN